MKSKIALKGFTLVEVIIALVIISIGILGVYQGVGAGRRAVDNTQSKIIAVNLAREGMEMIYNIRDTNIIRWSSQKNECWLKRAPASGYDSAEDNLNGNLQDCEDDFNLSTYSQIKGQTGAAVIFPFTAVSLVQGNVGRTSIPQPQLGFMVASPFPGIDLNLVDGIDAKDFVFALCKNSSGNFIPCSLSDGTTIAPSSNPNWALHNTKYGQFFRAITIKGLFDKETGNQMFGCQYGNSKEKDINGNYTGKSCGDERAKELVFCSRVEYKKWSYGKEELCGSITNWQ